MKITSNSSLYCLQFVSIFQIFLPCTVYHMPDYHILYLEKSVKRWNRKPNIMLMCPLIISILLKRMKICTCDYGTCNMSPTHSLCFTLASQLWTFSRVGKIMLVRILSIVSYSTLGGPCRLYCTMWPQQRYATSQRWLLKLGRKMYQMADL